MPPRNSPPPGMKKERRTRSNCTYLGVLRSAKGAEGELLLALKRALPKNFDPGSDPLFVAIDGSEEPVPFYIRTIQKKSKKRLILGFEDIETQSSADPLIDKPVYLPNELFDPEEREDELPDLRGYSLLNARGEEVATIDQVYEHPGNKVLAIGSSPDEVLIPYSAPLIIAIDHHERTLKMEIPEGLLPDTWENKQE